MPTVRSFVEMFYPDVLVDIQTRAGKTLRFGRAETLLIMDSIPDDWKLVDIKPDDYGRAIITVDGSEGEK